MREERSEPSPESNAEEPVTVRVASEHPSAAVAKKSSGVEAKALTPIEARESDPDGMLEIESLSQGTLEPVTLNGPAEASRAKDADLPSAAITEAQAQSGSVSSTAGAVAHAEVRASKSATQEALGVGANKLRRGAGAHPWLSARISPQDVPRKQISAAPASRRNAVWLGLGGLCVLGILLFALRPRAPHSSDASVSAEPSPTPLALSAQSPAPERQVALGRDEASQSAQGMDPNRNSQQAAPASPSATPSVNAASEPAVEDTVRVAINIRPEGTRVFYRGKEVGRTPFTLELLRGESRVFEVGYPGYSTRRLVIDGMDKEVSFNMTPDAK